MAQEGTKHGHVGPTQTGFVLLLHWLNCPEPALVARTLLTWAVVIPILQTGHAVAGPAGQGPCLRPCTQGRWPQPPLPGSLGNHGLAHLRDPPRKASPYVTLGPDPSTPLADGTGSRSKANIYRDGYPNQAGRPASHIPGIHVP